MKKLNWFEQFWQRLQSETPAFFKKARNFAYAIIAAGGLLAFVPEASMPSLLLKWEIDKWLLVIGAVSAFWTKLPTTDINLSNQK